MSIRHVVARGESLDSIAFRYGFFPPTIWEHPENRALRETREDMNILSEGDVVFIPDRRTPKRELETGRAHVFRRRAVPARLRLRLACAGVPRAGMDYVLVVAGVELRGRTDDSGHLDAWVPPNATEGTLRVADDPPIPLRLGDLDPITTVTGVQQRLTNLGFECNDPSGDIGASTRAALRAFQKKHRLEETGEPDPRTRAKLSSVHDKTGELAEPANGGV